MIILKCFADEEVWNETSQEECLDHTEGSGYWASGSVLSLLEQGHVVHTPFARYKAAEKKMHPMCESRAQKVSSKSKGSAKPARGLRKPLCSLVNIRIYVLTLDRRAKKF